LWRRPESSCADVAVYADRGDPVTMMIGSRAMKSPVDGLNLEENICIHIFTVSAAMRGISPSR
jgi:hypothetical protein